MTNVERLLRLAAFLEELPENRFDYTMWVGLDWKGAPDLSCGTVACALGWATTIPEFRDAGLSMKRLYFNENPRPFFDGRSGTGAAASFFGIPCVHAAWLFLPDYIISEFGESPPATATSKEVAAHIRRYVELEFPYEARDHR